MSSKIDLLDDCLLSESESTQQSVISKSSSATTASNKENKSLNKKKPSGLAKSSKLGTKKPNTLKF